MQSKRVFASRRAFVAATATGLGGLWLAGSSSWPARFLRARLVEIGRAVRPAPHTPVPNAWKGNALTITWLGHATILLNFYGVRILTDPAFYPRVGVSLGLGSFGPKRMVGCALPPELLPEIDLVLVSHAHFDHLDVPSLAAVPGKPMAVMASSTSDLLPRRCYSRVHELRWGESARIETPRGEVAVRAIEVKHWGARLRRDTHRGYNGYIIEREGLKVLFGGDTALTPLFRDYRRYGPFEVALMPVGAYNPWISNHCTPEEAVAMADAAGASRFVPIHHQSFKLSNEPFLEPIERTVVALRHEPERLAIREVGQTAVLKG